MGKILEAIHVLFTEGIQRGSQDPVSYTVQINQGKEKKSACCSDNSKKNISTTSSSISSIATSTATCYARGLAIAYSRKLSATLGGSTSTRPGVRKITLKTCDFVDITNRAIPTTLGGSTTTSPPIVVVILRQQLNYVIVDYGRVERGAPDKS
jgi:hypothetical protein